ncbi:nitrogenase iron-molybdenum cofactor biosynthesis protein NifN [Thiocapsa imhoffii]|uniref:Nitrogenase iron-molybdenum cofactor biosynthesis protein NifN n=1 Tax=Thiocapsa imhoffii TaxID=382777 RepID=A0A9X0WGT1_9GAMM|nr:nitrogenase iron-molybdenum cofactor biosynthesis protein NifN [Thiocapsa imhoffii]MBK1644019.1 nitrogenase iron-molybdenum cofactor biosynthesis protein NifN [Thiocapsa imhoffii]
MPEILKRNKALSVSPLKASSTVGAALAFLGFARCIPMLHGSQGCTAFGKIFFVRHFREPIPLQTTAIDQVSAIMGSEEQVVEGLRTLCEKSAPDLIGVPTTALVETQGSDVAMAIRTFRRTYPDYARTAVVPVATPDFTGSLESGYAQALAAIIETLVPMRAEAGTVPGRQPRQINVLPGAHLTPGDIEHLKDLIEAFGLTPVVVPDLSDSLDGHLPELDYSPLTIGGTRVSDLATLGDAAATLVFGPALDAAADILATRTEVPTYRFAHLMGLDAVDRLVMTLAELAGCPVPAKVERQRAQLQDAMLDCHFMLSSTRVAVAADPDFLLALSRVLADNGAELVAAVAPANAAALRQVVAPEIKIGDLEDLESIARARHAEILIGNAHAVQTAARLGVPFLRAGFPQYDRLGGFRRTWIGYQGTRDALFDLANLLLGEERGEIHPYHSRLKPRANESGDPLRGVRAGTH